MRAPHCRSCRATGRAGGRYRVLAELAGHEPAEAVVEVKAGERRKIELKLEPILGTLQIEGAGVQGATVKVDGEAEPRCTAPCELKLVPGRHALKLEREGHEPRELMVDVEARKSVQVAPELALRRGAVVVRSDVRDATIEVDGATLGFTPSVLSLAAGRRRLSLRLPGYRPVERWIDVKPGEELKLDVRMTEAEQVSAVSRTEEDAQDAPASLSILRGSELRAMRYPTIAEALRGVRGAYVTDDRSYTFVGFRGISRTQDYGNKVTILQDGLLMNDNILVQSYAGHEGRTDLDDIERIEVVRGPGSVLYGTNAFLGVINLVTRRVDRPTSGEASLTTSDHGLLRLRGSVNLRVDAQTSIWTSVAAGRAAGRDFHFPDFEADSGPLAGNARGLDGFDTGTVQGRATHKAFTLQWFGSRRSKSIPTAAYEAVFGAPARFIDTHGRLEARFEPRLTSSLQSLSRAHVSTYDFSATTPYAAEDGGVARETYKGRWVGLEQRFLANLGPVRLIAGGELQRHFTVSLQGNDDTGPYLDTSFPYTILAGYGLLDAQLHERAKLSLGTRVDHFSTFGTAINPRGALVLKPWEAGTLKLMGGKAFRAPSAYELNYETVTQQASPQLQPENIYSGEVEYNHRLSELLTATASVYYNQITGLIVPRGAGTEEDRIRLENSSVPVDSMGTEVELRRDLRDGWMITAWGAFQSTSYRDAASNGLRRVPNSPRALGSLRLAFPILGSTLRGMTRFTLESSRHDRFDTEGDPPQGHTAGAAVWDLIFSGESERYRIDYNLGFYNIGDHRYAQPVSGEFRMRTIVQPGRTALAHLGIRFLLPGPLPSRTRWAGASLVVCKSSLCACLPAPTCPARSSWRPGSTAPPGSSSGAWRATARSSPCGSRGMRPASCWPGAPRSARSSPGIPPASTRGPPTPSSSPSSAPTPCCSSTTRPTSSSAAPSFPSSPAAGWSLTAR